MREKLSQYVSLLFEGTQDCEDIKQEILQNTLDRYDDLIAEGKAPEAAYRLAISGIGDISEILGSGPVQGTPVQEAPSQGKAVSNPIFRAIAIALYIISPTPLFILSELGNPTVGLCGCLALIAIATALIILSGKKAAEPESVKAEFATAQQELRRGIATIIRLVGLILYFVLSFVTNAWHITWLVFPLIGAIKGLAFAILDLKEAVDHEN